MERPIAGAGGGKPPKQYVPTTAKDTLDSTQYLQCIDLLSEGEIEGFPSDHPLKDIYLDGTPVIKTSANPNNLVSSDYNFEDVNFDIRYGTANQTYIAKFPAVAREVGVGVDFTENDTPVTRTITDTNVNAVRITLSWGRLEKYTDQGDTVEASVAWEVEFSYNGGPYTTVFEKTLTGRSGNAFQRSMVIPISGAFPVNVRVTGSRLSPTNTKLQNSFTWSSYTELVYAKLTYPYRAYVALRAPASAFNALPVRSFRVRGIKVRIPNNATVNSTDGSLTYSGVWSGTFQAACWTTDPVWVLYDLLLSDRYGLGDHIAEASLNKWAFYQASVYANGRVLTGVGSETEPRFSCHAYINSFQEAYKLISDLASISRCMPYWSAGGITLAQDRPTDVSAIFTQSNVVNGEFSYSSSSRTQRHTVAAVSWLDRDRQQLSYEYVEDRDGIARYGVQKLDLVGFACSSRSQARRIGLTILATERYETDVVSFRVTLDSGSSLRPGAVIAIEDTIRTSGARYAGRIVSGTTTTVVIDIPVTSLPSIGTPTVLVTLSDGTVASRAVSASSGSTLTLASALPAAPLANGTFIYNDILSKWRVLGLKEGDSGTYEVTALQYNADRYANVERYIPLNEYTIITKVQYSTSVSQMQCDASYTNTGSDYSENQYTGVQSLRCAVPTAEINSTYSQQFTTQATTLSMTVPTTKAASAYSQVRFTGVGQLDSEVATVLVQSTNA